MEQYFEITKESKHYQEYYDYDAARSRFADAIRKFNEENGINTDGYIIYDGYYWVDATAETVTKFKSQLRKERLQGCCSFRKNSAIGKAFIASGITKPSKPFVPFSFKDISGFSCRSRLFSFGKKVYCSISCDYETDKKLECPAGFIEMKASEFFKIIEEAKGAE